jgi:transposase
MLLADRGYDADWIRELAAAKGGWANIPPKRQPQRSDLLQPVSLPRPQSARQ